MVKFLVITAWMSENCLRLCGL